MKTKVANQDVDLSTVSIVVLVGAIVFILYKSGIFKLTSTISQAVSPIIDTAGKVVVDVMNLPENVVTLATSVPDVLRSAGTQIANLSSGWQTAIHLLFPISNLLPTFSVATPTARAQRIVDSINELYPNMTMQQQLALVRQNSITFDGDGNAIDRYGNKIT